MAANLIPPTHAEPNMVPEYEVRLQLNPTVVLGPDHKLAGSVLSSFDMPQAATELHVQFLDTNYREIYTANWSPRIRKTENEDDLELTYKKRYTIMGSDIDAALTAANRDGFNAGDEKYKAQVEWGYNKQTLSISRKKTAGSSETDLPGASESRKMLIDKAPGKFDNWRCSKWGTSLLANSRIFGPVCASRYIGTWNGMSLYIEVWPLRNFNGMGTEYIIEASFKTESRTTASVEQSRLAEYLQSKHWFLKQDSLKTQLIMERY
jgi:hypothetical protein